MPGEVVLQRDSALPWLLGVARHTLAHRARSRMRHQKAVDRLPRPSVPDHADSVVAKLVDDGYYSVLEEKMYDDDQVTYEVTHDDESMETVTDL